MLLLATGGCKQIEEKSLFCLSLHTLKSEEIVTTVSRLCTKSKTQAKLLRALLSRISEHRYLSTIGEIEASAF